MVTLRDDITQLAHRSPPLRAQLLPLLRRNRQTRTAKALEPDPIRDALLGLFHHIHHHIEKDGLRDEHEVHHCGGKHVGVGYNIVHCGCGKHCIDTPEAIGHGTKSDLDLLEVKVRFTEECPEGGWHIESGKVTRKQAMRLAQILVERLGGLE